MTARFDKILACECKPKKLKNINYDLIKLLHSKLDNIWRLENHYLQDAKDAKCHSMMALEEMVHNERECANRLRKEICFRVEAGIFD